jgi:cell division protein ZapB
MESEIQSLEDRVRQAADLCKRLRAENVDLRQRIAVLENDSRRLQGKIDAAAQRLEVLIKGSSA